VRFRTKLFAGAAGAVLLIGGGIGAVSAGTSSDQGDAAITQPVVQGDQASDREDRGADRDDQTADREDNGADRDDPALSGTAAERAKAAATAAVPGATVRSVERDRDDDNPRAAYEVELVKPDGSTVEVELDADYKVIHIERDHDADSHDGDD
jgi:uncharacterized membrane protein YkoI